jgi:SAM-dependent methyltransferase
MPVLMNFDESSKIDYHTNNGKFETMPDILVNYNYYPNVHTVAGAQAALPILFSGSLPNSLLDVGCGLGTWIRAAMDMGVLDVYGIDGIDVSTLQIHFPPEKFRQQNLACSWNMNRKFDVVLSLEVAEHIDPSYSELFVQNLVRHGDTIFFSAGCPGQCGQNHVNCRWPAYWQSIFNANGFACSDHVRWQIWDIALIEPWYRQNIFVARRDTQNAGAEPRIRSVIHPEMVQAVYGAEKEAECLRQVETGRLPVTWYLRTAFRAFQHKFARRYLNVFTS